MLVVVVSSWSAAAARGWSDGPGVGKMTVFVAFVLLCIGSLTSVAHICLSAPAAGHSKGFKSSQHDSIIIAIMLTVVTPFRTYRVPERPPSLSCSFAAKNESSKNGSNGAARGSEQKAGPPQGYR